MYGSDHKVLCLCCVLTAVCHFATYLNHIFADRNILKTIEQMPDFWIGIHGG